MLIATAVSVHVCECCGRMLVHLHEGEEVGAVLCLSNDEAMAFGQMFIDKLRLSSFYASAALTHHREGHA